MTEPATASARRKLIAMKKRVGRKKTAQNDRPTEEAENGATTRRRMIAARSSKISERVLEVVRIFESIAGERLSRLMCNG